MRTLVFATGDVGSKIVRFLSEQNDLIALVIDDSLPDRGDLGIASGSGLDERDIFRSSSIYEVETVSRLRDLAPDLAILAWWPYIIREPLISLARLGTLNTHPSYLPYNRGKDPNFWSLVEGTPFGVTIHHVEPGIDNGDIAFQRSIDTSWEDTGGTLHTRAVREIVNLFVESWPTIRTGDIPRIPQDDQLASFHTRAELTPASEIALESEYSARELLNLVRARTFPPHPAAWFTDEGAHYEVRVQVTRVPDPPDAGP